MDIGIRLVDKTDEPRDIEHIVALVNEVLEPEGYRVRQWGEWDNFRKSCVAETEFYKELGIE